MADLEKLALKRDKGYLVRLVLVLLVGIGVGLFFAAYLTGTTFSGCVADAFVGGQSTTAPE